MYSIYYSLSDSDWQGVEFTTNVNTQVKAFMVAVKEMRRVLATKAVEFLIVDEMEFVVWAYGTCKGFLRITECGPKT